MNGSTLNMAFGSKSETKLHDHHPLTHEAAAAKETLVQTMRQFSGFASLMRLLGALIILAAMSAFLLQGWHDGDDISRYYMLLSQTGLLAAGGFALSFLFRENKGARVFFGLGLISITVNMTTLGALIFSATQWGGSLTDYPSFAQWTSLGTDALLLAIGATLLVCAPIGWFSHKVFARQSASRLSALFLAANLLLLVPVRESWSVGLVAALAILVPVWFLHQHLREARSLRTPEGMMAIASVMAPAIIILFRSIWLYPLDELLMLILSATSYLALRCIAGQFEPNTTLKNLTNSMAVIAAMFLSLATSLLLAPMLAQEWALVAFTLPATLCLIDMAMRGTKPDGYIQLAVLILAIVHIGGAFFDATGLAGAICMLAGMAIIALGVFFRTGTSFILGTLTLVIGTLIQFRELIETIDFSNWVTLSITGAIIIISASLIERHGAYLKLRMEQLKSQHH